MTVHTNTSEDRAKVLERIRKMLAIANSTNFEGEANTAMKMAQDYMAKHGLSLDEVTLSEELAEGIVKEFVDVDDGFKSQDPERWALILSLAVAKVFDVKAFRTMLFKGSRVTFAGYKSDVQMAKFVYVCMYVAIRAAACKAIPVAGRPRLSFMLGVASRLVERADEEKQTATQEPTGRFELVVRTKQSNIDEWLNARTKLHDSKQRNPNIDPLAYHAGRAHGDRMDMMNREKVSQKPTAGIEYK